MTHGNSFSSLEGRFMGEALMSVREGINKKGFLFRLSWLLAVGFMLLTGGVYREVDSHIKRMEAAVWLPVALEEFPLRVGDWSGSDVLLPEHIQRVAGNDDYLNRFYANGSTNQWANIYISYCGQPRTMVGHRPEVCYVAGGWIQRETEQSQFITSAGRPIPCLIHRFYKPAPSYDEVVVLNFYILNGRVSSDEGGFSGIEWRAPNIGGEHARYVAQIQISSALENSVRAVARDITERVLDFFPDENNEVRAADYTDFKRGVLK